MALNDPEATRVGGLGLPFEDLITLPSEAAKQLPTADPGAILGAMSGGSSKKLCAFSLLPLEQLQDVPHVRWVDGQPCLVRPPQPLLDTCAFLSSSLLAHLEVCIIFGLAMPSTLSSVIAWYKRSRTNAIRG